jgi:hypothetical protein
VIVTDKGATPLTHAPWPGSGAVLGRALEGIDAGRRGRVRNVASHTSHDLPSNDGGPKRLLVVGITTRVIDCSTTLPLSKLSLAKLAEAVDVEERGGYRRVKISR